jgi:S-DNA-T family DNA segregation ATPase FtsK/SpoIIIE
MAKNKKNGQKTGLIVEIISLLLIFFAIFSLISLFGYDPADASWANIPPAGHQTHNFGGSLGAYLAETLLQIFGLFAFFLPIGLGYLGL